MDILVLLLLIGVNGLFSMSEIAVIAAHDARLKKMADEGGSGAASALKLKSDPAGFLSTIQVGITMVGILSGALGENILIVPLTETLSPLIGSHARPVALTVVVIGLTYFTVVIGELVPKQLGLLDPERIAAAIAAPMRLLARAAMPVVWLFSASSRLLLRLIRVKQASRVTVSNEEIRHMMEQGADAGVFHKSEREFVANVLRLDEQPVVAIMTPRQDIYALDLEKSETEIRQRVAECPYSRILVYRGGFENICGLLRVTDLLKTALVCEPLDIESSLREPMYVPEYVTTTQLLEQFRDVYLRSALVVDEYGDVQGLVTLTDVLTAIVGEVPGRAMDEQRIVEREDGSWLIDGGVPIDQVKSLLKINVKLPGEGQALYHTLAGFVLYSLGRVPRETDAFDLRGFRFEVVDMDRNRIDKVLVSIIVFQEEEGELP